MKIEQRDPIEFKPGKFHPALKQIPELSQECDEFLALAATVKKTGFIRPLLVDEEGRLVDDHSRTLWRVALRWQLKAVPVQVVKSAEANLLLVHSLAHVRHMTKSAIAYLLLPVLENEVRAALAVHREKLAKGQYMTVVASGDNSGIPEAPTLEKLCADLGFSKDMLDRARIVHAAFLDKKSYSFTVIGGAGDGSVVECTLKDWFEPKILRTPHGGEHEQNRPLGLGGVISAIEGIKATKDKSRNETGGQMELFEKSFIKTSGSHYKYWHGMSAASRREALEKLASKADFMKPADCEGMAEFYREIAKVYAEAAKAKKV